MLRFIRLQGKQVVESVYDPALNSIFLAWDVLVPKYAKEEWESFREERPTTDPAYNHRQPGVRAAPAVPVGQNAGAAADAGSAPQIAEY